MHHDVATAALSAVIADWVTFGDGCVVGDFALLGRLPSQSASLARQAEVVHRLHVGARTEIGPHAIVYGGVHIGSDCLIGDAASIREGTTIGNRCVIGRRVLIGYDVMIGDDVRIQDGACVVGGCTIGDGSFIGLNVTMSNDRRRDVVEYRYVGAEAPVIGKRVLIGSGANLLAGVRIGDGAVVGAGALVVRDVRADGLAYGHTAQGTALDAVPEVWR